MSIAHTTHLPAARAARSSLLRWIGGGLLLAAAIAAVTIAVWPASETDKARDDGERVGRAVSALSGARSATEVDAALADLDGAVRDTRAHAGDAVAEQIGDQRDALARAADGFVGAHTSDSAFDVDLYQAELNGAVDDISGQAADFREQGPAVRQAFWDGIDAGLAG